MTVDRVGYTSLLAIALYGVSAAWRMPFGEVHEPGPGFFPLGISTLLLLLSAAGIAASRRSGRGVGARAVCGDLGAPGKIVLATGVAVLAFEPAGFLVTSVGFLALLFLWVSRYPWWKAVALAAMTGVGGWLLFVRLLGVALPQGLVGF
jgi:hypothetical protein